MKVSCWSLINCVLVSFLTYGLQATIAQPINIEQKAKHILDIAGIKGGLVVHIGCGDGKLTTALYPNECYLVHGLDTDEADIAKARTYIHSKNLYGPVSVAKYNGKTLHMATIS